MTMTDDKWQLSVKQKASEQLHPPPGVILSGKRTYMINYTSKVASSEIYLWNPASGCML